MSLLGGGCLCRLLIGFWGVWVLLLRFNLEKRLIMKRGFLEGITGSELRAVGWLVLVVELLVKLGLGNFFRVGSMGWEGRLGSGAASMRLWVVR